MIFPIRGAFSAGVLSLLAACGGGDPGTSPTPQPKPVASVSVSPSVLSLLVGQSGTLTAQVKDASGAALSGRPVAWSTSDAAVATVSSAGMATGVASGTATITATSEGKSGTATVTVSPVPAASVSVTPPADTLYPTQTSQFAATVKDSAGGVLSGRPVVWMTSNGAIATISTSGLLSAIAVGSVTVSASVEGKTGIATLSVIPVPVATVTINPDTVRLAVGATQQLTATARDSSGKALLGRETSWASSTPAIATVSTSGLVTALARGVTTIIASSGSVEGKASVRVGTVVGDNVDVGVGAEGSIAINPTDPMNLVASANEFQYSTFNGGFTWQSMVSPKYLWPGADAAGDPNVVFDSHGVVFRQGLGWPHQPDNTRGIAVLRSIDKGQTFPEALSRWAYAPSPGEGDPDQGILAIDKQPTSPYRDRAYIVFSDYPVGPPSYAIVGFPLAVVHSGDGGQTFSSPIDISDGPCFCQEHSSYITTGPGGEVYVAWIDISGSVMFDRSYDGGRTWGTDIRVRQFPPPIHSYPLSDDVRGNITVDVDRSTGPFGRTIYVSSIDINGPGGSAADAWVVRSTDGGSSWSNVVLFSDGPRGPYKYYFQPRINVAPNGRVDAVWYDTRLWTGTNTNQVTYDVFYTYSLDGGKTFAANVRVTDVSSVKTTTCAGQGACAQRVLYEYIGLTSDNRRVFPLWTDMRRGGQHQFTAELEPLPP